MSQRRKPDEAKERATVSRVEGRVPAVPQPDIADSFRRAKAALDGAVRDIVAVRRRAGDFTRRSR
jgi:hypothetical protein